MSLESGRHRRPRGQSGRGGFWLLAPRNVMLLAFAVGLLLLGLTTMSWHSSVLSALPSSGGATLERSSVTQLAATGGGSAGSIGGVAGRQLADNTASLDDRQRVVSDGKATLVPAKAGRGTRRVMLASHGRLQWYYPDTDTTQLLHEGGGVHYGTFPGTTDPSGKLLSVWVMLRPHNWRPKSTEEVLLHLDAETGAYAYQSTPVHI
mmetsp:Transcript_38415/g.113946  ORF Transcript_38415/g.113946 Transcript_38415/m.113946 type:complete len:206 (+) Transcript_38415:187-804(+)